MSENETPERPRQRPGLGRPVGLAPAAGAALVAIAWGGAALADRWSGWAPAGGPMGGMLGRMMFDQLDADGDGRVSRAEMEAYRAARLQNADKNGDGRLDQQEFEAFWLEVTRPARIRAFQFFDADADGVVTAAELQRPSDRMFARMDRDGDGFLVPMNPAERERMRDRREDRGRGRD